MLRLTQYRKLMLINQHKLAYVLASEVEKEYHQKLLDGNCYQPQSVTRVLRDRWSILADLAYDSDVEFSL